LIYGLHALSVLIGLVTAHAVVGRFAWGLPSIIAVIMNYAAAPRRAAPGSRATSAGRSAPSGMPGCGSS